MDYQELIALIDKLDQSNVAYLEYSLGENKVVLSKEVPLQMDAAQMNAAQLKAAQMNEKPDLANRLKVEHQKTTEKNSVRSESQNLLKEDDNRPFESIKSPIVGVVYLQAQPDVDPYVALGEEVTKGQTVCIIEAMKLMNEIVAPFDGIIKEILVENDSVVEFDQPLFKIEPK